MAHPASEQPSCPVCQRSLRSPHATSPLSYSSLAGRLTCSHCREHWVVSWSGHCVRDPFTLESAIPEALGPGSLVVNPAGAGSMLSHYSTSPHATVRTLRRHSHPLARLCRDLGLRNPQAVWSTVSSALILGSACWMLQSVCFKPLPQAHTPQTGFEVTP